MRRVGKTSLTIFSIYTHVAGRRTIFFVEKSNIIIGKDNRKKSVSEFYSAKKHMAQKPVTISRLSDSPSLHVAPHRKEFQKRRKFLILVNRLLTLMFDTNFRCVENPPCQFPLGEFAPPHQGLGQGLGNLPEGNLIGGNSPSREFTKGGIFLVP